MGYRGCANRVDGVARSMGRAVRKTTPPWGAGRALWHAVLAVAVLLAAWPWRLWFESDRSSVAGWLGGMTLLLVIFGLVYSAGRHGSGPDPVADDGGDKVIDFERSAEMLDSIECGLVVMVGGTPSMAGSVHPQTGAVLTYANVRGRQILGLPEGGLPLPLVDLECRLRGALEVAIAEMQVSAVPRYQSRAVRTVDGVFDLVLSRVPGNRRQVLVAIQDVTLNDELAVIKDGILSSVSHELRTPLTNVCAVAEILAEMPPENAVEAQEFLDILRKESLKLSTVVSSILEYSRLRSGDVHFQIEPVDAKAELASRLAEWRSRMAEKDVQLRTEGEDRALYCLGASKPIRQVLDRLLDNALRHTPSGGAVTLGARDRDDRIEFYVADNGKGVRPENREKIFDSFEQLQGALTDKPDGLGLGLTISRHLIRAIGGEIHCEPADTGGARFVISLATTPTPAGAGAPEVLTAETT